MNEREKTRGGKHWDPRGASRPRPGRSCGRSGGRAAGRARSWAAAGCQASWASPPASAGSSCRSARPALLWETFPPESRPPAPYAWTLASPRGGPHSAPRPVRRRAGPSAAPARTGAGRPLKPRRALPGLPPLARAGRQPGGPSVPGPGPPTPGGTARCPHSRVHTD